jgi:branched-chain amino acid transport system substrate-binding protein
VRDDTSLGDEGAGTASVRTFLIADVRGYTRYSEMHGDEAASGLARRFAVVAGEAVRARGGEVVELRGDEALCVFASARAAVRGAVELQRRVRVPSDGEPFPLGVGIGLDAGEAVPTAGGYRGRALNVAARLCSLAKGGEILASEAVAHLAGQDDEAGYAPRRPTTVKGLAEPLRFVEVVPKVELPPPPPPPSPERHRRRRTGVLLIGVGLAVAAGAALAAVQLSRSGEANPAAVQTIASERCSSLYYQGEGSPDLLIAADLPLQPGILATTSPMVDALTLALERRAYRAGPYGVGLQVCDDAAPGTVAYDEGTCLENAKEYAENPSVVGVVGPLSSSCAKLEIPVLNRAPGGPVAIVSPSNTYVGLTRSTPAAAVDEPAVYYPTRERNYARVLPADDVQAAANAIVAQRLGVKRVYALDLGEELSVALVTDFIRAARRLGIAVAGRGSVEFGARRFEELAAAIARTGADGLFLGGASSSESVGLLRDLRARLGPTVQFMASDGFDPGTAVLAGASAQGMTISVPGPLNVDLGPDGDDFVAAFSKKFGAEPARFAVNAAQAIEVLLAAIARSDGTRASVTRNLFTTSISNGILGSFRITLTGDTTLNTVSIYRILGGEVTTFETVAVPDALVGLE